METEYFVDKNQNKVVIGDECIWENRIGEKRKGIFKGIEGPSGQQAEFLPEGREKPIYVSVEQLYRISGK